MRNMDETNESSFIETALKHHSSAQAAIKILQEQLACLNQLRNSTKQSFILEEEDKLERSTNNLLFSTSHYLIDSPEGRSLGKSPVLSSTLNKQDKLKDEAVIRNLLPTFEEIQVLPDLPKPVSPIKPHKATQLNSFTPLTTDSLASTALPLTPFSVALSKSNSLNGSTLYQSALSSPSKSIDVLPPSSDSMNLTEVLARLAYSSIHNCTNDDKDSIDNTSDELIGLLDKISRTGEQLKTELQDAKLRESKLVEEVHRLRTSRNGYSPNHTSTLATSSGKDLEVKCEKLEDALLSLQDENIKLNRLLKGRRENSPLVYPDREENKTKLEEMKTQNSVLHDEVDKMTLQLSIYEKKLKQLDSNKDMDVSSNYSHTDTMKSEAESRLEEKVHKLEDELHTALSGMNDNKNFELRINDLHRSLLDKDNKIKIYKAELKVACEQNRDSMQKYENLQRKDVYKRKEVLQLCDKFEKMKSRYKKLESEIHLHRIEDQKESTKHWALENSLQKLTRENQVLQTRLRTEQRQISMSKSLLEKDFTILRKRYDDLLMKISRSTLDGSSMNTSSVIIGGERDGDVDGARDIKPVVSSRNLQTTNSSNYSSKHSDLKPQPFHDGGIRPPIADEYKRSLKSLQRELNHRRRHTVPGSTSKPRLPQADGQPNGLRVRSDTDIHYLNAVATSTPKHATHRININKSSKAFPTPSVIRARLAEKVKSEHQLKLEQSTSLKLSRSNGENLEESRNAEDNSQYDKTRRKDSSFHYDIHRRTKSAYEQEYMKNVNGLKSTSDQTLSASHKTFSKSPPANLPERKTANPNDLRSKSEVLSSPGLMHRRRRLHTAPGTSFARTNDRYFVTESGVAYGESAYSKEYLANMDGVRLVVNLSNGSNDSEKKTLPRSKSLSPIKSILRTSTISSNDASLKVASNDIEATKANLPLQNQSTTVSPPEQSLPSYNHDTLKSSYLSPGGNSRSCSRNSQRSLHLSDLPSDQLAVYDKFRNFDSHLNDYKRPPKIDQTDREIKSGEPDQAIHNHRRVDVDRVDEVEIDSCRKLRALNAVAPPERKEEDGDSVDQSSASTTRDHAGRVEFLREMQINTGVRMPALMHNVTIRDDVIVDDRDMDREIRLGLSNSQEAYADKLVKKYTRKAKKALHDTN